MLVMHERCEQLAGRQRYRCAPRSPGTNPMHALHLTAGQVQPWVQGRSMLAGLHEAPAVPVPFHSGQAPRNLSGNGTARGQDSHPLPETLSSSKHESQMWLNVHHVGQHRQKVLGLPTGLAHSMGYALEPTIREPTLRLCLADVEAWLRWLLCL